MRHEKEEVVSVRRLALRIDLVVILEEALSTSGSLSTAFFALAP